ncbi:MAG: DegQ family serine endoprotease [Steroidobacteraceae bacterium]|nr:DegQ family serine endoprotease [Steroidobacteraceae bacterium]
MQALEAGFLFMMREPCVRRALGAVMLLAIFSACSPKASTASTTAVQPGAPPSAAGAVAAPVAAAPATGSAAAAAQGAPLVRGLPDFSALVQAYGGAVVNIDVVGRAQRTTGFPGLSPDDPFYEFFRRFGPPQGRNAPAPRGQGSGFIVSSDGYILTNAHVVDEATEVTVRLTDRREFPAKVVGVDRVTDVAVLKIEARNLPVVKIGNPDRLRPGEWVVAIGSPFGFENSVTAGIVSALARSIPSGDTSYVPFIQTDVAVNPGNSGGPLFNLNGEVVGINSQIFSRSGGYMGLSFAIPIDIANNVREQLVKNGRVRRGRIGVSISDVSAQFAESFGLDRPRGALVGTVEEGGPADKAGVQPGDIILQVNGQPVERSSQLPVMVAALQPGSRATLQIWRERAPRDVTLTVGELTSDGGRVATGNRSGSAEGADRLGLSLRELTREEQRQANTSGSLLVEDVTGPAADANIQPGDIVLGVNNRQVKTLREFREATRDIKGSVALRIQRGDNPPFFVAVRPQQ